MGRETLRFGIYLPPMGPLGDPAALVELARVAEAGGWDGVFLWDHVAPSMPPIADTWTALGAIATATESVLLGPMITPLARRRPWVVARQASTVSRLSRGRLVLGVGIGTDESGDFTRFGDPASVSERKARLEEGLPILRGMWSGAAYRHDGDSYHVDLDESEPEPHPIPVWMASSAGHPGVLARAVHCDGIFHNPDDHEPTPEEIAGLRDRLREAGLAEDRPYQIAVRGNASSAWAEEKNVDLDGLAEAGVTWWMESLIHFDPLELSLEVAATPPPR